MRKSSVVIVIILVLLLCVAAMSKETIVEILQSAKYQTNKKCSTEIENLKLCTNSNQLLIADGEKAVFTIFVTNIGSEDLTISNQLPIEINAYDEEGKKMPPILQIKAGEKKLTDDDFKKIISEASISHRYGIVLKSQQSWEKVVNLNNDYNLNKKGKYFIEVKIKLPVKRQNDFVELTLDKIEIVVK